MMKGNGKTSKVVDAPQEEPKQETTVTVEQIDATLGERNQRSIGKTLKKVKKKKQQQLSDVPDGSANLVEASLSPNR